VAEIPIGTGVIELEVRGKAKLIREAEDARRTVNQRLKASPFGQQHTAAQDRLGDLRQKLSFAQSNDGKRAFREEAKLRAALSKSQKDATSRLGEFRSALSTATKAAAAAGVAVAALFKAASIANAFTQESITAVGLSNPALSERLHRTTNDSEAIFGRGRERTTAEVEQNRRAFADAQADRVKKDPGYYEGSMGWMKRQLEQSPVGQWMIDNDFMGQNKAYNERHGSKGKSVGAAYDERMGQRFGGDDLYKAIQAEALKMPATAADGTADQAKASAEALKELTDAAHGLVAVIAMTAPGGVPAANAQKFAPGD
jgi:hypothetical protein